jgi:hypothetical protein
MILLLCHHHHHHPQTHMERNHRDLKPHNNKLILCGTKEPFHWMLRVSFEKCGGIGTPSALFQVPAFVVEPDLMDDDSVSEENNHNKNNHHHNHPTMED